MTEYYVMRYFYFALIVDWNVLFVISLTESGFISAVRSVYSIEKSISSVALNIIN
jgi:hypothetical protein